MSEYKKILRENEFENWLTEAINSAPNLYASKEEDKMHAIDSKSHQVINSIVVDHHNSMKIFLGRWYRKEFVDIGKWLFSKEK